MTTVVLSKSDKKAYWNGAYFFGELRRSWAHALLYTLAFFFSLTVPMMSKLSDTLRYDYYSIYDVTMDAMAGTGTIYTYDPVDNRFAEIPYFPYVLVAMVIAVWAGIFAVTYLNRRVSAYFYHSLPIAREGILLVKSSVALTDLMIALAVNIGLTSVFYLKLPGVDNPAPLFVMAGYCLLAFAVIYAFVVLLGALCGTSMFHMVLIALSIGLLPLMLSAIYLLGDMVTSNLNMEYLLEMRLTSPYFYLFDVFERVGELSVWQIIFLALFAAASFVGTLLLVRFRPTEAAESSIAFRPVGAVIKYAVVGTGAILGGFLFKEMFWGEIGFIFGFICGLLLTFMLMNVLLSRSVRQMFRGLRVLLIFALVLIVVEFGICWAYTYRDDHVFSAKQVKSVSIREYSGYDPIYGDITDPEAIELTSAYLKAYFACVDGDSVSYTLGDAGKIALEIVRSIGEKSPSVEIAQVEIDNDKMIAERFSRTRNVWLTQTVAGGLSYSWRVTFGQYPELEELEAAVCRAITDSESFKTHYVEIFEQGAADIVHFIRGYTYGQSIREDSPEFKAMMAELREQIGYDFFQRQQISTLKIRVDRRYYTFPIYSGQTALIKMLGYTDEEEMKNAHLEEVSKWLETTEDSCFTVYKRNQDGSVSAAYYEPEDSETVWMASAVHASFGEPSIFTRVSSEYAVGTVDWEPVYFLYGKEPQFILDLFE